MKTVILCGGMGTRLSEETTLRPKPMVSIGAHPILWHIMSLYGHQGFNNFVLALGYKADTIKEYFLNYHALSTDFQVDLSNGKLIYEKPPTTDWKVSLIDTGLTTLTGGRLKRLESQLKPQGTFMLTYGDGVADVDINALLKFHRSHGKLATITVVRPSARFGGVVFEGETVTQFKEKPQSGEGWINGGFFVFEPGVFKYLADDS
ncbi:MAG: sugar phosphate nucleotidyltransferase, partial [Bdellovibrionota bacterium]